MNPSCKVLHVIPSVGPARGGPSMAVRAMAHGLALIGVDVHVLTTDDNGRDRLQIPHAVPVIEDDVTYRYFPRQTHVYQFSWPLARWLARHVQDYDLLHIHTLFAYPTIAAAHWARARHIPYIVRPLGTLNRWGIETRRPLLKKLSMRCFERRILSNAAVVHFTSEQERLEAQAAGIGNPSIVIANPVHTPASSRNAAGQFFAQYPDLSGRPILLFLSRLDRVKGLDLLLPAFAKLRAQLPEAALVIAGAGDPEFVAGLRQQAARLGIAAAITWTGLLGDEQKRAAFDAADMFVLPSYSENFGLAAAEALACGLPVVVSDRVAIHHEIQHEQAGLITPCDVDKISEALLTLALDPDLRRVFARRGQALARRQFSVESVSRKLLDTYTQFIGPEEHRMAGSARTV